MQRLAVFAGTEASSAGAAPTRRPPSSAHTPPTGSSSIYKSPAARCPLQAGIRRCVCVCWPSRSFQPGSQPRHRLYRSLTRLPTVLRYASRSCNQCLLLSALEVASRPPRSRWHHGSWIARRTPAGLSPCLHQRATGALVVCWLLLLPFPISIVA